MSKSQSITPTKRTAVQPTTRDVAPEQQAELATDAKVHSRQEFETAVATSTLADVKAVDDGKHAKRDKHAKLRTILANYQNIGTAVPTTVLEEAGISFNEKDVDPATGSVQLRTLALQLGDVD